MSRELKLVDYKTSLYNSLDSQAFSFFSSIYWRLHPRRESVDSIYKKGLFRTVHEGFELLINSKKILQSLSVLRPYERYLEVERGDVCLDIGAAVGEDSFHMIRSGAQRVYTVEADPDNFYLLEKNIRRNELESRIIPLNIAAWNRDEFLTFYKAERPTDGGLFENHHPDSKKTGEKIEVPARRLDKLIETKIDFIKMNIEGAELEALEGMERILDEAGKIFLTTDHYRDARYTTSRVMDILLDHGFRVEHVNPKKFRYVVGVCDGRG